MVELNRAVARAMADGVEVGLDRVSRWRPLARDGTLAELRSGDHGRRAQHLRLPSGKRAPASGLRRSLLTLTRAPGSMVDLNRT